MPIIINTKTKCMIQGITGKEGLRALQWMSQLGAQILAGVTPGKGGTSVSYTNNGITTQVPVFNSVAEAKQQFPEITATAVYVPPRFVFDAVTEALDANLSLIHVIAEGVPIRDTATLYELIEKKNTNSKLKVRLLGPSSIGAYSVGQAAIGSIAAGDDTGLLVPYSSKVTHRKDSGGVVILSKSGGMALTVAHSISSAGIAVSTVVGLGGDVLVGTTFADLLEEIQADTETWAVVLVGEIGGTYEEMFAEKILQMSFQKPVVAFISGRFAELLPQGVSFGHAGAIVSKKFGTRVGKITALQSSGVLIADTPQDIVKLLKEV